MMESSNLTGTKFSVVIPVYNRAKILRRCIDSVLNSSYANIEVLVVDDGSTDESWNIITSYNDSRVVPILKKNGGVSSARNVGLKQASGEYVHFVDSDDFVKKDIYKDAVGVIEECHPDMILVDHGVFMESNQEMFEGAEKQIPAKQLLDRTFIEKNILSFLANVNPDKQWDIENFVHNKLYKRSVIENYSVYFDESRRRWEDRVFQIAFLKHAQSFYYLNKNEYFYVLGNSSFAQKYDADVFKIIINAKDEYRKILGDLYDFECEYTIQYYCKLLINTIISQFGISDIDYSKLKQDVYSAISSPQCQKLFAAFSPENDFEKQIKEFVVCKSDKLFDLCLEEFRTRKEKAEKEKRKNNSICNRIIRKLKRIFK